MGSRIERHAHWHSQAHQIVKQQKHSRVVPIHRATLAHVGVRHLKMIHGLVVKPNRWSHTLTDKSAIPQLKVLLSSEQSSCSTKDNGRMVSDHKVCSYAHQMPCSHTLRS